MGEHSGRDRSERLLDVESGPPEAPVDPAARAHEAQPGADVGGFTIGVRETATPDAPPAGPVPLPAALIRPDDAPFVGRAGELERLHDRWRNASRTAAGLVIVTGEPGIGKTRLVARFAAGVHAEGGVILCGRADEESVWPYQPFVEALRHYATHRRGLVSAARVPPAAANALVGLVPELAAPAETDRGGRPSTPERRSNERDRNRYQLFEAIVRLLLHAAHPEGLLLVLEDLHWTDSPTMLLLRHVLRRGAGSRMLVVATFADHQPDASGPLADLRSDVKFDTVHLTGLQPADAGRLVAARAGPEAADQESVRRLCDETGGNPFFIEELLRSPAPDDGVRVPAAVKHVIGRRLDRLPREHVETLTLAAVLGNDFALTTLEAVATDQEQDELLEALEAAVEAGLILEHPEQVDRFSFTHALVRETLYERPITSRRLRLHRRVAEALEVSPLPVHPAELAHHYFQARNVGGAAKAMVFNLQAAEAAQAAHAYEAAVEHYQRALSVLPLVGRNDPAARCDVLLALGTARWQASEPNPRSAFAEALTLARELGSPERLARATLGVGGRFYAPAAIDANYTELLEEALVSLGPGDTALRARLLARLAENLVFVPPPERAQAFADDALDMARRVAEPSALAAALMGRHAALLHIEHAPERRRLGEELLAVAGELEDSELAALARHWLLYDLAELGELDEARRRHAELERIAAELQQPLYRHSALAWRGVWAGLAGRFGDAERLAHEAVRLAQAAGDPDAQTHFTAQLVAIRREQGRLDELLPEIERSAGGDAAATAWRCILPLAYLDAGEPARARAAYDRALGAADTRARTMLWLTATSALCEASAELGDADGAARLYADLEPYADRLVQSSFTGSAGSVHRLLGRAAAAAGRRDDARRHFEAALARHAELKAPALLARTRCDYGELLLQGEDPQRAHQLLRAAAEAAGALGMTGVAARAGSA
jgi:AAA ATPase domain